MRPQPAAKLSDLGPIFGQDFEHPRLEFYGLPRRYRDIQFKKPGIEGRWTHFCVFYLPIHIANLQIKLYSAEASLKAVRAKAPKKAAQFAALLPKMRDHIPQCQVLHAHLRANLLARDPNFERNHPEERLHWRPEWEQFGAYCGPTFGPGELRDDGIRIWSGVEITPFWPDFEHEWMVHAGLPLRFDAIDWSDPRSLVKWLRFQVWFSPVFIDEMLRLKPGTLSAADLARLDGQMVILREILARHGWLIASPADTPPFAELAGEPPGFEPDSP